MSQGLLANQKPNVYEDNQVLDDETKGELGLPENATPNDALQALITKSVPTGSVFWLASQSIPTGFLLADGSAVSRTEYANLFKVIGTTFGTGDGSTTFNLPNLQAAFIRGAGSQDGYSATFGQKQEATGIADYYAGGYNRFENYNSTSARVHYSDYFWRDNSVSSGSTTVDRVVYRFRPFNIALTPIIKY